MLTSLAGHLKAQIDNGRVSLMDTFDGVLHQITLLDRAEAEGGWLRVGYVGLRRERCFHASSCVKSVGGEPVAGFRPSTNPMVL